MPGRPALLRLLLFAFLWTQLTVTVSRGLHSKPSEGSPSLPGRCHATKEYWSGSYCCQRCPAGQYVQKPCGGPHAESECEPCPPGTYTEHANGLPSCLECRHCSPGEKVKAECNATHNRECQCEPGRFYRSRDCPEECCLCSTCPKREVVVQKCNSTADTVCGPASPVPESRHWYTVIGSCLLMVALIICLYIKKPSYKGGWAACCYLPRGHCDRREGEASERSKLFLSSHENGDADSPGPTSENFSPSLHSVDEVSELPTSPGAPERPAGVAGPQAAAGAEAVPHAALHGLTPLHSPRPEGQAEVPGDLVDDQGPHATPDQRRGGLPGGLTHSETTLTTQEGLKVELTNPGRRGSGKGRKFRHRSRANTWVLGSLPTPCFGPWERQPVDTSVSRRHCSFSVPVSSLRYYETMEDVSSGED